MSNTSKAMLHQLLAVETDLTKSRNAIMQETQHTFQNKANLFMGSNTATTLDDSEALSVEPVTVEATETVPNKLAYLSTFIANSLNVDFSLAEGNSYAKADVTIDDQIIVANAPVLWLLGMETKLKQIHAVIVAAPTLAPGTVWQDDPNHALAPHMYVTATPTQQIKTAKVFKFVIMDAATKEHPAQIHQEFQDDRVGVITKTNWSGMLTSSQKSKMLSKVSDLLLAVKNARQKANTTEVEQSQAGNAIMDYILS